MTGERINERRSATPEAAPPDRVKTIASDVLVIVGAALIGCGAWVTFGIGPALLVGGALAFGLGIWGALR